MDGTPVAGSLFMTDWTNAGGRTVGRKTGVGEGVFTGVLCRTPCAYYRVLPRIFAYFCVFHEIARTFTKYRVLTRNIA